MSKTKQDQIDELFERTEELARQNYFLLKLLNDVIDKSNLHEKALAKIIEELHPDLRMQMIDEMRKEFEELLHKGAPDESK